MPINVEFMGIFTYSDFNFSFVLFLEFATLENFFIYFCVNTSLDGWNPKTTNLSLPVRLVVRDSVKLLNPPEDDSSDDSSAL